MAYILASEDDLYALAFTVALRHNPAALNLAKVAAPETCADHVEISNCFAGKRFRARPYRHGSFGRAAKDK